MRMVVLIMTGLGFTLGLLCGLLLHLPADGLPANTHPHIPNPHPHLPNTHSHGVRTLSDHILTEHLSGDDYSPSKNHSRGGVDPGSSHAASSGKESRNEDLQDVGQSIGQAKSSRKLRQQGGESGQEKGTPNPAIPSNNKPVTSFTVRLRNTGEKFVVDSAVQRRVDETGSNVRDSIADGGSPPDSKPNTKTRSSPSQNTTLENMVQGVLWSPTLEHSCPRGVQQHDVTPWRRKAGGMQIVGVEEGCGRMQNRRLTFKDGSQACARYRLNTDQIQGEVYSYYLAQLLGISNLPPAILLPVDSLSPQWRPVHLDLSLARWADGHPVVLTRWLDHLLPSHIPHELREDDRKIHPTLSILGKKTVPELCELLQWSDLIVFDYLTANLDRMVNNMFNRQWNAEMMNNAAHNLERTSSGSLVFLDNESGLFHGYRLLDKYHSYHEALLSSLCVFRESTARAVKTLHVTQNVGEDLQRLLEQGEVHHKHLPPMPEKNRQILQDRLAAVYQQIVTCERWYPR